MNRRLFYTLIISLICYKASSQPFKYVSYYLQHQQVSQDAIDFYTGDLTVSEPDRAISIVDSLFTKNDDTRPFYILLTSRMLSQAKGDLRRQLNISCRHFAEQNPGALAQFLFTKHYMVLKSYRQQWAYRIAVDIRLICSGDIFDCFKASRNIAISNCEEDNKQKMEVLYNYIRKELNLFQ